MMTERILLKETTAVAPEKKGNRWRVIAARPGQGSSGFYSEDVLREYGPVALAPGAQSFINHDHDRNPKDMIGTFPDGFYWDAEESALVGELEVFSHWKDFVEEVAPHVGMSLFAAGEVDKDGNVTALFAETQNGVDLVARPGLVGSGIAEKLYESAVQAGSNTPGVNVAQDRKEMMEIEKQVEALTAQVSELTEQIKNIVSAQVAEAEKTAQVKADEAAIEEALTAFEGHVTTINAETDLLPSQKAKLIAEAKRGIDVTPLIEDAKAVLKEAKEALSGKGDPAPAGKLLSETAPTDALALGKVFG